MKIFLPLCAAIALAIASCNNVGSCPQTITPGASCSGDNLSCPYTVTSTVAAACDGVADGGSVSTSCTCTGGVWVCPCEDSGATTDATVDGGSDAEVDGSDATMEETGIGDSMTPEAAAEAGAEAAVEAGPDGPAETSNGADASTDGGAGDAATD